MELRTLTDSELEQLIYEIFKTTKERTKQKEQRRMRKLKANEIECRVAQVGEKGCSLLLYKTARVDRAILDEEFGCYGWQNDFKVIDGKMYGGIGVKNEGEWLWRWDCGTESTQDAEKGQASDCFKRAGFKWGIGVELYSAPFIFIKTDTIKEGNKYKLKNKYMKFTVKDIGYSSNSEINMLIITDDKGNIVYQLGTSPQQLQPQTPAPDVDVDVFEGLYACDTSDNTQRYFKEFEHKVKDSERFRAEYSKRWRQLRAKEKKQNAA